VEREEEGREKSERAVPSLPTSLLVGLPASYSDDDAGQDRRWWVELDGPEEDSGA
jgi:hypothetical protein